MGTLSWYTVSLLFSRVLCFLSDFVNRGFGSPVDMKTYEKLKKDRIGKPGINYCGWKAYPVSNNPDFFFNYRYTN